MVGVEGRIVHDAAGARDAFSEAIGDGENGIIIITERAAGMIRPVVDKYIFTETFPLIVEIPDRTGPLAGRKNIRDMVNAAIGIRL
jgi:V/A-type H+-transporting ATPase subunit F